MIEKIGEGTFSDVLKARNLKTGQYYAIKCIKEKLSKKKVTFNPIFFPNTIRLRKIEKLMFSKSSQVMII